VVPTPTADDEAAALLGLIGDGYRIEPAARDDALTLVGVTTGPDVSNAGRCALARLDPGTAAWIDGLPPGTRVRVSATRPFAGRLFLSRGGPATPRFVDFDRGRAQDVVIPDIGDGRSWSLVVDSPRVPARVTFCVRAAPSTASRPPHVDVGPW
jgi:hypothetical protein